MSESASPKKAAAKKKAAATAPKPKGPKAKATRARAPRAAQAVAPAPEPFLPPVADQAPPEPTQDPAPDVRSGDVADVVEASAAEVPATPVVPNALQRVRDACINPPDVRGRKPIVQEGAAIIAERRVLSSDEPRTVLDRLAPVTKRLDARVWYDKRSFDWCLDRTALRHTFTRWYPEKHVLVDVFEADTARVRTEIEDKTSKIIEENERREARGHEPIGYLPMVRGVVTDDADFDAAIAGQQVALAEAVAV